MGGDKIIVALYSTQVIATNPAPEGYAGLEMVVGLLCKYIDEETDHTLYLFATEDSYVPKKKDSYLFSIGKAGTVNPLDAFKQYWNDERSRRALMESDIVCDHSWGYYPYAVADKLKNIMHVHHGPDPGFCQPPPVDKPCLITVGFQLARRFQEQTGLEWRTIHNGIDVEKYIYQEKKENYLLWLSRLYAFKGAHRFIKICNDLKMQGYVVGGSFGDDKNYINLIKDMCDKSPYVEYLGEVDFKKKLELLQNAKALIQPSVYRLPLADKPGEYGYFPEPFGLTTLEAMACGTPVVVSPIYGWTETLIHGYNGFHANSDEEFKYYIKRIDEIDKKNCRKVAEHFDYKRMGKEYLKLFNEIVGGRKW